MKRNLRTIVILVLLGLVLSACSYVDVTNSAPQPALVRVALPDTSSKYHFIEPGDTGSYMSYSGGRYSLAVLPSEDYLKFLNNLKATLISILTSPTPPTEADINTVVDMIKNIDRDIQKQTTANATCSGKVSDYTTASASVSQAISGTWLVTCPSTKPVDTTE